MMRLDKCVQPLRLTNVPDCEILGIHNDSRHIKPGYLFIAYPGALVDGRKYIPQAIIAGAAAIIYEPQGLPIDLPAQVPCLPVIDLANKLALLANHYYNYPSKELNITGVTGTSGKTTIAWQLARAYELLNYKSAYLGTLGQGRPQELSSLANTTPDAICVQQLLREYKNKDLNHVFMEVSSHALSLRRVEGVQFTQAIFSNLSHEHLDFHKTMEDYASAKASLFSTPGLKTAIINQDDEYAAQMINALSPDCQKLSYGLNANADIRVITWECQMNGSQFEVDSLWGIHHLRINTLGLFNIYNSLAIFTSMVANGISVSDTKNVLANLPPVPGRMEVIINEPCVIVDYAHKPDALEKVLMALNQLKQKRLIVVFGCGGDRDKAKRPMMGQIAEKHADVVILTSDNSRSEDPLKIIEEISQGMTQQSNVMIIVDRKQAIQQALNMADNKDIILIAGKGHESYQQIGDKRFDFSDRDIVKKLNKA